jgi:TIGR03009 family protein
MDMRFIGLTCTAFLLFALPAFAQNPATPTPPSPERLDALLKAWEKRMTNIDSFSTKITRTELHALTKKPTTFVGDAAFMKPNLAKLDLTHQDEVGKKEAEKTNFERIYCNGQFIYEYIPKDKLIVIHDIPKNDPTADNLILAFLRGMKAEDAQKRFGMALTKETEWYAYLLISPKSDADKREFTAAQLVIWNKSPNPQGQPDTSMMPCRLWYRQPNGMEVTYDFSGMQPNAKLDKDAFVPRQLPGFKVEKASALMAPKEPTPMPKAPTIRPQTP